jgi:uncharacterized protein (TIGR02246 family)
MNNDELTYLATRYTNAWNAHDAAASAGCYTEDGSLAINGGEPAEGRAAVQSVMQGFHDAFPDAVLTMDAIRGARDRAVFLWTYEGTNSGPGGTGNHVRFSGWEAWVLSPSGLVQRSIGTYDQDDYDRQLGIER